VRGKRYSSEGIVLARRRYSEADRILVVYSRNYGKISFMAKGVRKPKSRKRGSLEVFSHIKFSAARGRNLDIIEETEIIDSFQTIRKSLKRVAVAYYLMEVIGRVTREDKKNEKFFTLILKYLRNLKTTKSLRKLREEFISQTLVLLGFWPKGRIMDNPDKILENVVEREINSIRVGKKLLS
jgi:DNA repair protein RecO (recombination protein O)